MILFQKQFILMFFLLLAAGLFMPASAQKAKEVKTLTKEVETAGNKAVTVEINQAAGTLHLQGGAGKLMEGQFAFTREEWKPTVAYSKENGKLVIKQAENTRTINTEEGDKNEWQVKLNRNVPMDIQLSVGAGQSNIDLHGMKLTSLLIKAGAGDFTINLSNTSLPRLEVNAGVGAMKVDLTGKWSANLTAEINGGIGEISLKLPATTGARVKISGLGSIEAGGFKKQGGYYVNNAYGKSEQTLTIEISGGLGSVNLVSE